MRYYTYDNHNFYTGFKESTTNIEDGTTIQPISDEYTFWNGSDWELPSSVIQTFEQKQHSRIQDARMYFDEIVLGFESDAAAFEVQTWETQRQEWLMYSANVDALTPYCDALASARGIEKSDLMTKISYKVVGFAQLQGQLHGLEDMINACTTEDQLNQIVW